MGEFYVLVGGGSTMTIVAMPTLMCFGWLLSLNPLALLNLASRCVVYASLQCRSLHFPSIHFFAFAVASSCFSHLLLVPSLCTDWWQQFSTESPDIVADIEAD